MTEAETRTAGLLALTNAWLAENKFNLKAKWHDAEHFANAIGLTEEPPVSYDSPAIKPEEPITDAIQAIADEIARTKHLKPRAALDMARRGMTAS